MVTRYESELDAETHLAVLTAIADNLEESVMITEADPSASDPRILYVNPAFTQLTGYRSEEVVNETPKLLQGRKTERKVLDQLKDELSRKRAWKGCTYNYTRAGQPFLMEWEIVPIYDTGGTLRFYLTVQRGADPTSATGERRRATLHRWSDRLHTRSA